MCVRVCVRACMRACVRVCLFNVNGALLWSFLRKLGPKFIMQQNTEFFIKNVLQLYIMYYRVI